MSEGLFARTGAEFVANTTIAGDQKSPNVRALAGGGYVIVWNDAASSHGLVSQRYDATGAKVGGETILNAGTQTSNAVAALSTGGYLVSWQVGTGPTATTMIQLVDATGALVGAPISTHIGSATTDMPTSATGVAGGGFVLTMSSGATQIFDASGAKVGAEFALSGVTGTQVVTLSDGSFILAGVNGKVYFQHYSATGVAIGGLVQTEAYSAANLRMSAQPDGGFVIAWSDYSNGVARAQGFANSGTAVGDPTYLNALPNTTMKDVAVVALGHGQFMLSRTLSNISGVVASDVRGQVFDATGAAFGTDFLISVQTDSANRIHGVSSTTRLASGQVVAVWQGAGPGDTHTPGGNPSTWDHGIRGQMFSPLAAATMTTASSSVSLSEADVLGTALIGFSTTSDAINDSYSYQILSDSSGGAFVFDDGRLYLVDGSKLQGGTPFALTVRTTDSAGGTHDDTFNVTVRAENTPQRYATVDEDTVSLFGNYNYGDPTIGRLPNGSAVVAYLENYGNGNMIGWQVRDASGSILGFSRIELFNGILNPAKPSATGLTSGNSIITWSATYNSNYDIGAQLIGPAGQPIGSPFKVNTTLTGTQSEATVSALANGGFVIAWTDASATGGDTSSTAVRMQIFDATGTAVGGEQLVNTATLSSQGTAAIATLSNGTFVVTWSDSSLQGGDASVGSVKAQRYDATGAKLGGEFLVNTETTGLQRSSQIAALGDGFVITWVDRGFAKAQKYDAIGNRIGGEITLSSNNGASYNDSPAVYQLPNGGFVVSWTNLITSGIDRESSSIAAQVVDAAGNLVGDNIVVNLETAGAQSKSDLIVNPDGSFNVVWLDGSYPYYLQIKGRTFTPLYTGIAGTNLVDDLTGTAANDVLHGFAGDDRLDGGAGADTMYGGTGDDVYIVDNLGDVVVELAGEGDDTIKAYIDFSLVGISNVEYLRAAGSTISITGNADSNVLVGNTLDNVLDGGGGGDRMKGGYGNDTYIVRNVADIVTEISDSGTNDVVKAAVSYTSRADSWVETLRTIDAAATTAINLTGNSHTLVIQGNAGANVLTGGSGNETISGYAGNDTLFGGAGADVFVFDHGTGQDVVGDFVNGTDKLDLTAIGFASFAAVQAATSDVGGNAVIDLGGGDTVTLIGVTKAQLQSGDVIIGGSVELAVQEIDHSPFWKPGLNPDHLVDTF